VPGFAPPIPQWPGRWYEPGTSPPPDSDPSIYPGAPSSITVEVEIPSGSIDDIYSSATRVGVRWYVPYCYAGGPVLIETSSIGGGGPVWFAQHLDYVFASDVQERSFRFTSDPAPTGYFAMQHAPRGWVSGSGFGAFADDPTMFCVHRQFLAPWTCNYWARASVRPRYVEIYRES